MEQNAKRIFFKKDALIPSLEMEDGTVRNPYYIPCMMHGVMAVQLVYFTPIEFEQYQENIQEAQKKEKSKLNLIKP